MTVIQGIVKSTWEKEQKAVGYIIVNDVKMEINQENLEKAKKMIIEAKQRGENIEQRRLWLNENLNPLQSA